MLIIVIYNYVIIIMSETLCPFDDILSMFQNDVEHQYRYILIIVIHYYVVIVISGTLCQLDDVL